MACDVCVLYYFINPLFCNSCNVVKPYTNKHIYGSFCINNRLCYKYAFPLIYDGIFIFSTVRYCSDHQVHVMGHVPYVG